jgi:hypothetical protein
MQMNRLYYKLKLLSKKILKLNLKSYFCKPNRERDVA